MPLRDKHTVHADSIAAVRSLVPDKISSPFQTGKKDASGGLVYNPPVTVSYPADAKYANSAALGAGAVPADAGEFAIGSELAELSPVVYGDLRVQKIGGGLSIREGRNARMGIGTLSGAGTFIVYNTSIRATSRVFVTPQNASGVAGSVSIIARTAGVSFSIGSTNAADTRDVAWVIFTP